MKLFFDVVRLAIVLALLPIAFDWRSPVFANIRPWVFVGLVACSLVTAVFELILWRRLHPHRRFSRVLSGATLSVALLLGLTTLWLEARFQWARHAVLRADPHQLEVLGRHFIVGYRDIAEAHALIERRAIAGIFLTGRNVRDKSAQDVKQEIDRLQSIRSSQGLQPLWIATDQEGGLVSRLSPPLRRTDSPAVIVKAVSGSEERRAAVRQLAAAQGSELTRIGVNLNFAPVVDLNHRVVNPNDRYSRIHERAISSDPQVVTEIADAYCSGLAETGVRCTLKHFPGLGRVFEDTHVQGADLLTSTDVLAATDWVPFRALMRRPGSFMMLSHARLAAIDRARPVSFSGSVVAGLLRRDWQYDGVLVTDDFCMGAVHASPEGIGTAGIEALNAGVDLILIAYDPDQYYPVMYALLKAQSDGRLRRDMLDSSRARLKHATGSVAPNHLSPISP